MARKCIVHFSHDLIAFGFPLSFQLAFVLVLLPESRMSHPVAYTLVEDPAPYNRLSR